MAVFLTQNAPGLRTSPVKRGYWVVRRVLGETIPPPPADRARTAARRGEVGSAAARHAGQTSRESGLRLVPCALRFLRPGVRRLRPGRREADQGPRRTSGRYQGGFPGRQPGRRIRGRAEPTSASIARTTSWTISAANCWPTRSAGRCCSPMNPPSSACRAKLAANGYRFTPLVETIVTSPQFLNKRSPDSRMEQKGE